MIVQRLRELQNRHGFLPEEELRQLARDTGVPLYRIEEISSFFPAFRLERTNPPQVVVRVCRDMTCRLRGAADLLDPLNGLPAYAREIASRRGLQVAVEGVSCLGRCDRAPACRAESHPMPAGTHPWVFAGRSREQFEEVVRTLAERKPPPVPDSDLEYTPNTNAADSWTIDIYARESRPRDYQAVRKFIDFLVGLSKPFTNPPPDLGGKELDAFVNEYHPLLAELKTAGLLGMGGAGASAYQKWLDVWREPPGEKYIVANGDESEPGTFKDREIMLRMPHLVVEGVVLAGLMTGAIAGYIYVRHEYPEQIHALRDEIARARSLGACGENVLGTGRSFHVEVFESPGGYICGEQSALLEVMEDRRSQPRNRPPELTTNGLRDKPTIVNNVETLAWTPSIILRGGSNYASGGWKIPREGKEMKFIGRRLFSVSGDVRRPGVYEVPVGLPLRELIENPSYCGGVNGTLKAIATSGPSGGLLPARLPVDPQLDEKRRGESIARIRERSANDAEIMEWFLNAYLPTGSSSLDVLDVPLDLNFFRNLHSVLRLPVEPMLGAGLVVYADGTDVLDQAVNFTEFYRNESCGKCIPCRLGSQKLVQIGTELLRQRDDGIASGEINSVRSDVHEITRAMQLTSICGLGYVAPIPLATVLAYFHGECVNRPGNSSAKG